MNENANPLRIAIYCHTHTQNPIQIDYQRAVVMDTVLRCADVPPEITVYADNGFCPSTQVRPAFQRLLQSVAEGETDCIAVNHWDHLSVPGPDADALLRFFRKHEVLVIECRAQPAIIVRIAA
ncbi:recombinase family protein [Lysobacter enzymogenes]|uniref:recombinase family protein n=1 Tax=Lysobacter enzymogenes TaxID=69 RepID=UPI001AF850D8|nr:recombinase family protein [Lysobacter enzymogenes]QQQ01007.1 recombinase family protein [Lysobacter enzymogenes]